MSDVTIEDKQELLDTIAGKTYDYLITIWGYGGELVYNKLTKSQYDFWEKECAKTDEDGYDCDYMFANYLFDQEQFEEDCNITIPEEAKIDCEWYECDDLAHANGVSIENAYISIDALDIKEDPGLFSRGKPIGEIVEQTELQEFITEHKCASTIDEFDLDNHADDNGHNYVMYAMSVEKGTFVDCHLQLTKPIDISKLAFESTEYPNGDTILEGILYDGEYVDYEHGDTNGKAMNAYIMDY